MAFNFANIVAHEHCEWGVTMGRMKYVNAEMELLKPKTSEVYHDLKNSVQIL